MSRPSPRPVVIFVGVRKNPLEHRPALEAAHRDGFSVVLLAEDPPAGLPREPLAAVRAVDPHDTGAFDAAVDDTARAYTVAGVVSWSDAGVEPAARAARRLGLPGIAPAAARLSRNKYLMRRALAGRPHLVPRFARVRTWHDAVRSLEDIGLPAVLKPAAGSGSKGIFLLRDAGGLRPAFDELTRLTGADGGSIFRHDRGELLLEELLVGSEHSVEGFVHRGEVTVAGITDKTTSEPFRLELAHLHPAPCPPPRAPRCSASPGRPSSRSASTTVPSTWSACTTRNGGRAWSKPRPAPEATTSAPTSSGWRPGFPSTRT